MRLQKLVGWGLALICSLSVLTAAAYETPKKVIRVGFPNFPRLSQMHEDGTSSGIVHDYLLEIGKYTGWEFEYVTGSVEELHRQLEGGELDVMGGLLKVPEVESTLAFSALSSGITYSVVAVKQDNVTVSKNDFQALDGMRVGVSRIGNKLYKSFVDFCNANGVQPVMIELKTGDAQYALNTGLVEAVLTNDLNLTPALRPMIKFSPSIYYFATPKDRKEIMRGINEAMFKILEVNPRFNDQLYTKYFDPPIPYAFLLTEEEKAFIRELPSLRVTAIPNWKPLSIWDSQGELQGISRELLTIISDQTGLMFTYQPVSSMKEMEQLLAEGQVDIIAGVPSVEGHYQEERITLTAPYLPLNTILLQRQSRTADFPAKTKIAVPLAWGNQMLYRDAEVIMYDSVEQCIRALMEGEVEFAVTNTHVASYALRDRWGDVITILPSHSPKGLSMGIHQSLSPMLISILDKAILSLDAGVVDQLLFSYSANNQAPITMEDVIRANPVGSISCVVAVFLVIGLLAFFLIRTRSRMQRVLALEGKRYKALSEIAEEYLFEYNGELDSIFLSDKLAMRVGKSVLKRPAESSVQEGRDARNDFNLFASFSNNPAVPHCTSEFLYMPAQGDGQWFRAITNTSFDAAGHPVVGMGKLLSIQKERQELQDLEEQLNRDALTGVSSRAFCAKAVERYYTKGYRPAIDAFFVVDIDRFKAINDRLGHRAGDEVLKLLAQILSAHFPPPHLVGRWGGDEFVIFYRDAGSEQFVSAAASALCKAMDRSFTYEGETMALSLSVGISIAREPSDFDTLFRNADKALYLVKEKHRNGFAIYPGEEVFR